MNGQITTVILATFAYDFHCYACRNGLSHNDAQHQELIANEVDADMDCEFCRDIVLHSASQHEAAIEEALIAEAMAEFDECECAPSEAAVIQMADDYYRDHPQVLDEEYADYLEERIHEVSGAGY